VSADDAEDRREQWSGAALMERGLVWPLTAACTARVWVLRSTEDPPGRSTGSRPSTGAGKRG